MQSNIQVHSRTFKKNIQARTLKEHSSSRTNMNRVPFCRISRCSQRMSPMNGGARLRNASRSSWTRSLPSTLKLLMLMPSRLNSQIAQLSHCITWIASQLCGSVRGHEVLATCTLRQSNNNKVCYSLEIWWLSVWTEDNINKWSNNKIRKTCLIL